MGEKPGDRVRGFANGYGSQQACPWHQPAMETWNFVPTVRECRGLELPPRVLMDCSHPLGSFSFNSRCSFHCAEGYTLDGPRELQCLASGTWTDKPPQCVGA